MARTYHSKWQTDWLALAAGRRRSWSRPKNRQGRSLQRRQPSLFGQRCPHSARGCLDWRCRWPALRACPSHRRSCPYTREPRLFDARQRPQPRALKVDTRRCTFMPFSSRLMTPAFRSLTSVLVQDWYGSPCSECKKHSAEAFANYLFSDRYASTFRVE